MIQGVWAILIAAFLGGVIFLAEYQSSENLPTHQETLSNVQGNLFVAYRNACVNYAIAHRTFSGSIPTSSLLLPAGYTGQITAQNAVSSSGGVSTVHVWAALEPGAAYTLVENMQGDESYGVVKGGLWVSPIYGVLGSAPTYVASGDILSIVQIGG